MAAGAAPAGTAAPTIDIICPELHPQLAFCTLSRIVSLQHYRYIGRSSHEEHEAQHGLREAEHVTKADGSRSAECSGISLITTQVPVYHPVDGLAIHAEAHKAYASPRRLGVAGTTSVSRQ